MNEGKIFERDFISGLGNIFSLRLNDPAQSFGNTARFSLQNPYDFLVFHNRTLFCLELKSTKSTSISFAKEKSDKNANIKFHQLDGLTRAANHENVISGLILNFRASNKTYFISIQDFNTFAATTEKKSINENDLLLNNAVILAQSLKRTRYTFHSRELIETLSL